MEVSIKVESIDATLIPPSISLGSPFKHKLELLNNKMFCFVGECLYLGLNKQHKMFLIKEIYVHRYCSLHISPVLNIRQQMFYFIFKIYIEKYFVDTVYLVYSLTFLQFISRKSVRNHCNLHKVAQLTPPLAIFNKLHHTESCRSSGLVTSTVPTVQVVKHYKLLSITSC